MAKLCLLSDHSLVGQWRTPRANSTEARRTHRLVSDVEQLIGIHADALFREPNLMVTVAAAALAGRSGAVFIDRLGVSGDVLVTEVHQRPRCANNGIAGAQYRAVSPPLPSGAGRTRSWWGAAGSGEGYRWNCRTSVPGRRGVGGRCCSPAAGVVRTRIKSCGRPRCRVSWRMTIRLGVISVRWVSVHVAMPATVHSSNTVDNASPHRNTSRLVSPRVDSTRSRCRQ